MKISKDLILIAASFLLLFAGCQKPVEIPVETPVTYTPDLPIDSANFFSSPIFGTPNDNFLGTLYEEIFPYHVDDIEAWQEEIEWDREKTDVQLEMDYPDFDPLVLLKNHPEVLVQNFTTYKGENMVDLETVQRMQHLWEKLDDFGDIPELWTPSKTSEPIPLPEGFLTEYWESEESIENLWSELMYVDLNNWEQTEEEVWKSYEYHWDGPNFTSYFSDNTLTNFKLLLQEEGFLLLNETLLSGLYPGGSVNHQSYQVYSYDASGRFQEGLLVKKREGITYDEPIFTYKQAFYNEEGRLEEFRISSVDLASNQLSIPRLIYTHERYVAR